MAVTIRNRTPGKDPIAQAHQRALVWRAIGWGMLAAALVGGLTWLLFSSAVFAVTDIRVEGVSSSVGGALRSAVEDVLGKRTLGFLRPARNILFLDEDRIAAVIGSTFKNIDAVQITKDYPHTLHVIAHERVPIGTWCRGDECQYFDMSGSRWGTAVPSRGPLLLLVRDERQSADADARVFVSLKTAVDTLPDLGLHPITVTLPDTAPGDLWIRVTVGYDVILDALGDVDDQLATLSVFVADKATDPTWKPQYIDVRTPGRVYFK